MVGILISTFQDENVTWDNPLLPMLKKNALPQQRLYFCLAINAMNIGFLRTCFFGACWRMIVVIERLTFNIFLISYSNQLNKYIKKDVWNDPNAKNGLLRGRHSFCHSYPSKGQEQLQRSDISTGLQTHWKPTDGNRNQLTRPGDTKHWPPSIRRVLFT